MDTSLQIMTWGSPKTGKCKKTQFFHENLVFEKTLNYLSKSMVFHVQDQFLNIFQ